jgi:hypothetical protein
MNKKEPITFKGMHVYAAYNIRETLKARELNEISDQCLILENVIIFATNHEMADLILYITGFHPECEVVFYLHLPQAKDYQPLIRSVTKNNKSFPYYFNN